MYGTKDLALQPSLVNIWAWAVEGDLTHRPHPCVGIDDALVGWEPCETIGEFISLLQEEMRRAEDLTSEIPDVARKRVEFFIRRVARKVPESLVSGLWIVRNVLRFESPEFSEHWFDIVGVFIKTVHTLAGTEHRLLVGTKDHKPAWCKLDPPVRTMDDWCDLIDSAFFDDAQIMPFISEDDTDLIPHPLEWVPSKTLTKMWKSFPDVDRSVVEGVFESAYYNQHFTPYPHGMVVRIEGHTWIKQLTLKVNKGVQDANYLDFLARIQTVDGELTYMVNGADITHEISTMTVSSIGTNYLDLLIAQIFHDLVTVRRQHSVAGGVQLVGEGKPEELNGVSWIYIPRTHRLKNNAEIRLPSTNSEPRSPHRVQGHPRKGNMSEEQRFRIEEFEASTGLEVLRHLPEGHTYVRPHVSPLSDVDELSLLPKFVRTRLQNDLIRIMQTLP
ncbi:hypothetical protein EPO04_04200 [Patescibacteria group bacterium]|nr:MAG: hypothetical protein EPO04_04200 [Patescibacteria group bacterium]